LFHNFVDILYSYLTVATSGSVDENIEQIALVYDYPNFEVR